MRRLLLPLLIIAAGACDRPDPVAPGPASPSRPSASATLGQVSADPTPDQLAVAQVVPGFGGYFIDDTGSPTVWLTDPAQRTVAAQALAGFLSSFGWSAGDLKVRQAQYDYLQLDAWYQRAWPRVLAVAGAVSTDLDEGRNRLRFTGVDASVLTSIAGTLASLDVPAAATVLQIRGPVRQLAGLRDKIRPPFGGLQIQFFPLPASPLVLVCTIGFNALRGNEESFITNSHCSNVQGGTDTPTDYYQSTRGLLASPDNYVAHEVDDPTYASTADCPLARLCRYSDASRAKYGAGQRFTLGLIARTQVLNATQLEDDSATLVINPTSPNYRIAGTQATPVMGQTLNKVGRTTGWTQGKVVATCENVSVTDSYITQLCQSLVGAFVAGGDSGSPVFGLNTDGTVFLGGILWGSSTDLTTNEVQFIFSPFASIEREMGTLTVADPTLTVTKGRKKQKP